MNIWIDGDWIDGDWIQPDIHGAHSKAKPFIGYVPHIETDKEFTKKLLGEMTARQAAAEEQRQQVALQNAEFERSEHFRKLAKIGQEKRQQIAFEENRRAAERNKNLERGRKVHQQNIQQKAHAVQKSDVAQVVERKRANKAWGERMRKIRKHR